MKKYQYKYNTFYNEDETSFYLLGAFMTDGCVQSNGKETSWKISISSKDEDWLDLIRRQICQELPIKQGNHVKVISITDKKIGEWFIKYGCVPKKSLILEYPNILDKYFPDFLRGCIDGDGSISQRENKKNHKPIYSCYLCSANILFLQRISEKLHKLNINNSVCKVTKKPCFIDKRMIVPRNNHYRLTFGSKATYKLMQLLYYSDHKLSMPRKLNKAKKIIEYYSNLE